uniref:hypothetical protein n=1 Tax=Citrobacter koseri TaxID=545 RepID=UPI001F21D7A4
MNRFNENLIMLLQGLLVTVGILLWGQGKASVNTVNISATIPQKACSIAFSGSGVSGNTMDLGDINPADFSAPGHSPGQAVRLTLTDCGLGQDGSVPVVQLTGGSSLPPLWHGVLFRKGNSESDLAGGTSSYYWVIVGKDSNPVYSGGGLFQTCSEEG